MAYLSQARALAEELDVPIARASIALDTCKGDIVAARALLVQKAIPLEQRVTDLEAQVKFLKEKVTMLLEMHSSPEAA